MPEAVLSTLSTVSLETGVFTWHCHLSYSANLVIQLHETVEEEEILDKFCICIGIPGPQRIQLYISGVPLTFPLTLPNLP